ncbi:MULTISPECIES: hypothetical protein [Planococcaceae]|uniref:Uncharacterized protein n=1 Tax=Planococcus kocurii TaxID=1374 RepID=A0ABM5WSJ5_9BACL|nr:MULTISPECIES: hypothetical protein [Planococcaceae]ALS77131.1 hypothetical protein AUO94_00010 [Planococcus kocurii]PKH10669.1 hypothetical protein CXF70_08545 [Planomicrobium sp. MB-3u-38]
MVLDVGAESLWEILKSIFGRIKYSFLSKNQKIEFNLSQLQKKYWFEQLVLESPSLVQLIKNDHELQTYLTSRRKLQKVLHNSTARKKFKEMINQKL